MAQEAIDAYRDFHDARNEFAQAGFPADQQGELRLHASGDYADTLLRNWETGREYSLHQEGSIRVESIAVVSENPSEQKVTLAACEDFSEVELLDSDGESVGDIAEGNSLAHVSMQLMEDRYEDTDIWVITDNRAQQDEEC